MKEKIISELKAIEIKYDITILFACETGSRAWAFASPDSDYDVRFIYRHQPDWYLSIENHKDTIEYLEGDLDLVGWDIRKSLRLMRKSNASIFERMQSPMIYLKQTDFLDKLKLLAPDYFSCRAGLHHYLSMAHNYCTACEQEEKVKLKSYFYLLRTSLASLWIVENGTIPPLEFRQLLVFVNNESMKGKIESLLELKARVDEKYLHPKEVAVEAYVKSILSYCGNEAAALSKHQGAVEPLNQLFRETMRTSCHCV